MSNPPITPVDWLVFDRNTKELLAEGKAMRAYQAWEKSHPTHGRTFAQCLVVQREDFVRVENKKHNRKRNGHATK